MGKSLIQRLLSTRAQSLRPMQVQLTLLLFIIARFPRHSLSAALFMFVREMSQTPTSLLLYRKCNHHTHLSENTLLR
jgi:hypothetical protein